MNSAFKECLWSQFGAAIDMLENAINACSEELWSDTSRKPEWLEDGEANRLCRFSWGEFTFAELLLVNMRHVQHHAAQLNLLLRQNMNSAPGWVARTVGG